MFWKTLCQMDLHGKRVLTRVDLNVPMVDGKITDATRIEKIVPTINEITKKVELRFYLPIWDVLKARGIKT